MLLVQNYFSFHSLWGLADIFKNKGGAVLTHTEMRFLLPSRSEVPLPHRSVEIRAPSCLLFPVEVMMPTCEQTVITRYLFSFFFSPPCFHCHFLWSHVSALHREQGSHRLLSNTGHHGFALSCWGAGKTPSCSVGYEDQMKNSYVLG